MWEWLLLLLPFVLPLLFYSLRPPAEVQDAFALPAFRMGPVSSRPPRLRWYAVQTTTLFIALSTLEFVALPSDHLWRVWELQARTTARPECQSTVEAMSSRYLASSGLVAVFGVFLPWLIFLVSLYVTYARGRPHP